MVGSVGGCWAGVGRMWLDSREVYYITVEEGSQFSGGVLTEFLSESQT